MELNVKVVWQTVLIAALLYTINHWWPVFSGKVLQFKRAADDFLVRVAS